MRVNKKVTFSQSKTMIYGYNVDDLDGEKKPKRKIWPPPKKKRPEYSRWYEPSKIPQPSRDLYKFQCR